LFSLLVLYASPASISRIVSAVVAYAVSSSARSRLLLSVAHVENFGLSLLA